MARLPPRVCRRPSFATGSRNQTNRRSIQNSSQIAATSGRRWSTYARSRPGDDDRGAQPLEGCPVGAAPRWPCGTTSGTADSPVSAPSRPRAGSRAPEPSAGYRWGRTPVRRRRPSDGRCSTGHLRVRRPDRYGVNFPLGVVSTARCFTSGPKWGNVSPRWSRTFLPPGAEITGQPNFGRVDGAPTCASSRVRLDRPSPMAHSESGRLHSLWGDGAVAGTTARHVFRRQSVAWISTSVATERGTVRAPAPQTRQPPDRSRGRRRAEPAPLIRRGLVGPSGRGRHRPTTGADATGRARNPCSAGARTRASWRHRPGPARWDWLCARWSLPVYGSNLRRSTTPCPTASIVVPRRLRTTPTCPGDVT